MSNFKIGKFEVDVSDPYPCWIRIKYGEGALINIRHDELRDLEYAVTRAIKVSQDNLTPETKDIL